MNKPTGIIDHFKNLYEITWSKNLIPKIDDTTLNSSRKKLLSLLALSFISVAWFVDPKEGFAENQVSMLDQAQYNRLTQAQYANQLKDDVLDFLILSDAIALSKNSNDINRLNPILESVDKIIQFLLNDKKLPDLVKKLELKELKQELENRIKILEEKALVEKLQWLNWKLVRLDVDTSDGISILRTGPINTRQWKSEFNNLKRWTFEWKLRLFGNNRNVQITLANWIIFSIYGQPLIVARNIEWIAELQLDEKKHVKKKRIKPIKRISQRIRSVKHPVPVIPPRRKVSPSVRSVPFLENWWQNAVTLALDWANKSVMDDKLIKILWKEGFAKFNWAIWKRVSFNIKNTISEWVLLAVDSESVYIRVNNWDRKRILWGIQWLSSVMTVMEEGDELSRVSRAQVSDSFDLTSVSNPIVTIREGNDSPWYKLFWEYLGSIDIKNKALQIWENIKSTDHQEVWVEIKSWWNKVCARGSFNSYVLNSIVVWWLMQSYNNWRFSFRKSKPKVVGKKDGGKPEGKLATKLEEKPVSKKPAVINKPVLKSALKTSSPKDEPEIVFPREPTFE